MEGHFVLTSGLHSNKYVEKFRILEDPKSLAAMCKAIADKYRDDYIDIVVNGEGELTFEHILIESLKDDGFDRFKFAWAGGFSAHDGRYFRIQRMRPHSLLIEQDNVQNGANHIHSVIRDIDEDFGVDLLRMHYEQSHIH